LGIVDKSKTTKTNSANETKFRVPIFAMERMISEPHTLKLFDSSINAQAPRFDIDYAIITVGDGDPS
jgi:hypothetical protein